MKTLRWLPLLPQDLESVNKIALQVHPGLPERPEVFKEKILLFPEGCRKLMSGTKIVGCGISHPWTLNSIPPLDSFLKQLPSKPDCIYAHDIAILPEARGKGASAQYMEYIKNLALEMGISHLAGVSVYGTYILWKRFGFKIVENADLNKKLASYGPSAKYIICDIK
ncbi:MAG: GNAT family N-acetyltransferase [Candidatus Thermoplasmatota archaeon]|nr:GNAT family N-acetyltransferase [Candidatus Thermoplasmatota archaeon]